MLNRPTPRRLRRSSYSQLAGALGALGVQSVTAHPGRFSYFGVPVLVPVRASPVPSVVRRSFVVKFLFLSLSALRESFFLNSYFGHDEDGAEPPNAGGDALAATKTLTPRESMRFGFFYEPTPAANRCDTDAPLVCAEGIPAANRCDTEAPPVCAEGIPAANRCDTDAPPVCAEGIPVAIPPPPLVEVFDFWNAELRQLTFHAGDPWSISYGRREERKNLQFVALAAEAPGAVPVYDWWSERDRRLTIHPPPAWEGESRRGLQFYAFEQPAEGTVAVHAYWNSSLKQITAHAGPPWGKDERTTPLGTILHAYPNHAAAPPNSVIARALYALRR